MLQSRTLLAVGLALLLVLSGCTGGLGSAGDDASDAAAPDVDDDGMERQAGDDTAADAADDTAGAGVADSRMLIRTGEVVVEVDDYGAAHDSLSSMARDRGGYVSDSTQRTHSHDNETWTTGSIVLRVPSEEFDAAFDDAKATGEVQSATTSSEDVTDQLVDIEARLANLRAERDRLRTLYEQANETEDVLQVSRELSNVQEEIERLEAQQRHLEEQVQYATITVQIDEREPEPASPPGPDAWWETSVLGAFLSSVSDVVTTFRAMVVAAAYVAPFVIAFGTPVVGATYLGWRLLSR